MYITGSANANDSMCVTKMFLFVRQQCAYDDFGLDPKANITDWFTDMTGLPHVNDLLASL